MEFWLNPDINTEMIVDSMQLDSNQEVAFMKHNLVTVVVAVRGEVGVWWNPDSNGEPCAGVYYTRPSEFPQDLKDLIAAGRNENGAPWDCDPRVYVDANNWFEAFVEVAGGYVPEADYATGNVVDVEGLTPVEVFSLLYNICVATERGAEHVE